MAVQAANGHGKSMAIWFPLKTPSTAPATATPVPPPTASLHFNLWRLGHKGQEADGSTTPDLLDIGIMVSSPTQLSEVSFYLPTEIDHGDVEDLAPKLISHELATGIFNEPLTASNGHKGNLILLENAASARHCGVFNFPTTGGKISASDLKITHEYDGTTFKITDTALATACTGLNPNDKLYFRLRIRIPKNGANTFINAAIPDDKWFTSGVDVTEYLDFRLNQARNLNKGIARHLPVVPSPAVPVRIERLDFLLVVGVAVDVVVGHPNFHKCRLLEKDLWKTYVDEEHLRKGMVIYHWKGDPGTGHLVDFNAFVKLRVRLSGKRIIKRYLLIALLFGAIAGVFGNLLYDGLKGGLKMGRDAVLSLMAPATVAAKAPEPPPVTADGKAPAAPSGKTEEHRVNGPPPPAGENGKAEDVGKKGTQG